MHYTSYPYVGHSGVRNQVPAGDRQRKLTFIPLERDSKLEFLEKTLADTGNGAEPGFKLRQGPLLLLGSSTNIIGPMIGP